MRGHSHTKCGYTQRDKWRIRRNFGRKISRETTRIRGRKILKQVSGTKVEWGLFNSGLCDDDEPCEIWGPLGDVADVSEKHAVSDFGGSSKDNAKSQNGKFLNTFWRSKMHFVQITHFYIIKRSRRIKWAFRSLLLGKEKTKEYEETVS